VNVVIVGGFWFPHGSASAARIRNLALGLTECGARVHVIPMVPPAHNGLGRPSGVREYRGISYEHVSPTSAAVLGWRDTEGTVPRLGHGFVDKVRWFAGLYGATPVARRRLRERIDRGECDLVVVYDRSAVRMTPIVRLCRARGVRSMLDIVEVSEHLRSRTSAIYWDFVVGTRMTPRLFDGLSVITTGLERLYRARGCTRTLIVPSIEEWRAWPEPEPTGRTLFHLSYVGALRSRDAPEVLLDAIGILAGKGVPVRLDVIGQYEGTAEGRSFTERCGRDPVLARAVRFLGTLSDEGLSAHLSGSDGLVLTRRQARTEELSFPTRLVEYLRYGRPVFVSAVGDVARYLRDGLEAVLLDPADPQQVAAAIAAVVGRPDRGAEIGRRGRDAGARSFDRKTHAARLLEFAAGLRVGARS
jgi:glycosyltransferase involved in cell wall biosynthesis